MKYYEINYEKNQINVFALVLKGRWGGGCMFQLYMNGRIYISFEYNIMQLNI